MAEVEFITVGNEILSGATEDTNFSFAARELTSAGVSPPRRRTSVGDVEADIERELKRVAKEADFAVVCGGLGPTSDDLTAECAARAFGLVSKENPGALGMVERTLKAMGREILLRHKKQAVLPEGADVIVNEKGVTPGFRLQMERAVLYFLPGVPDEFKTMFSGFILPDIVSKSGEGGFSLKAVSVFGMPESEIARRVEAMGITDADIAYRIRNLEIQVRVSHPNNAEIVDRAAATIMTELAPAAFSTSGATIAEAAAETLKDRGLTVSAAESCTGGMLAQNLTDIPGSSVYFPGGMVCYSNASKTEKLGVPEKTIEQHGAVSEQVALAMAGGVRERFGTDIGVGITGVAGPGGGTFEKPAGTVYIATSTSGRGEKAAMHRFTGDRMRVRSRSVAHALDMVMRLALTF